MPAQQRSEKGGVRYKRGNQRRTGLIPVWYRIPAAGQHWESHLQNPQASDASGRWCDSSCVKLEFMAPDVNAKTRVNPQDCLCHSRKEMRHLPSLWKLLSDTGQISCPFPFISSKGVLGLPASYKFLCHKHGNLNENNPRISHMWHLILIFMLPQACSISAADHPRWVDFTLTVIFKNMHLLYHFNKVWRQWLYVIINNCLRKLFIKF